MNYTQVGTFKSPAVISGLSPLPCPGENFDHFKSQSNSNKGMSTRAFAALAIGKGISKQEWRAEICRELNNYHHGGLPLLERAGGFNES